MHLVRAGEKRNIKKQTLQIDIRPNNQKPKIEKQCHKYERERKWA